MLNFQVKTTVNIETTVEMSKCKNPSERVDVVTWTERTRGKLPNHRTETGGQPPQAQPARLVHHYGKIFYVGEKYFMSGKMGQND